MSETGVFTLSLDTELAWGSFDRGGLERYAADYRRTPAVVDRLCTLLDDREIPATWAFVGHLLVDCDGSHEGDGLTARQDEWLRSAPCVNGADSAVWYAPDLLERVQESDVTHDVGLHGYSHLPLSDVDRDTALAEVERAVAAARRVGVEPTSFVYPRNRIGHTDVLAECGLDAYRGRDARWYEQRGLPSAARKPLRFVDEAAGLAPPTAIPMADGEILQIPASNPVRPRHGVWGLTPPGTPRRRAQKGLSRAADTGRIYHLWLHPFNLARAPDESIAALEAILDRVAALRSAGQIEVATMAAVARDARAGRWQPVESNSLSPADPNGATQTGRTP